MRIFTRVPIRRFAVLALVLGCCCFCRTSVRAQDRPAPSARERTTKAEDWFRAKADPESLRRALEEAEIDTRWIYHDLDAARARARESGKPILALFRCVPCGSAPNLDAAICTAGGAAASRFEEEIRKAGGSFDALLDEFVTVRMVQMNGVNRNVFRFDRDVPYVAVFLNADGVVYGRYGTRSSPERRNLPRHTLSSFRRSLQRALELHSEYPANRSELAAKRDARLSPAMPEDMPTLVPFPANPKPVSDCIHCHTVGEARVREVLGEGKLTRRDLWPYPLPGNLGVRLDAHDGLLVESVRSDSAASRAGVRAGDVLVRLDGQPLVSEADVQWALHHAPEEGRLPLVLRRGEATVETEVELAGAWRKSATSWRASLSPLRPNVHLRPDPFKHRKGAEPGQMGLSIRYPRGKAARAGLRSGDLLVGVDGRKDLLLEADFLHYIHFERPEAQTIELTVLRKGKKLSVTLPLR